MREPIPDGSATREDIYGVRRLLIGRLQQATRGVPLAKRTESLHLFARAWGELESSSRLGDLVSVLEGRQPENPVPAFLIQLALETEQGEPAAAVEAPCFNAHITANTGAGETGSVSNSKIWWVGNRQEELFPAGLAPQPV